jgi:hypothetical protein
MLKTLLQNTIPQWRVRGSGKWCIVSTAENAKISLCRWIRSGKPKEPVKLLCRDSRGKVVWKKELKPNILRQDISFTLPGRKASSFTLEISDSFSGDWSMDTSSQAVYAVAMPSDGIAIAHNGLHRLFIEVPAKKEALITYAGSHVGEWSIDVHDQGKTFSQSATALVISLRQFRQDAAKIKLPPSKHKRIVSIDCFSTTDARIHVSNCNVISADKRFFTLK